MAEPAERMPRLEAAQGRHVDRRLAAMEGIKSTAENLQSAIDGENFEVVSMYPPFIEAAEAEGARRAKTSLKWAWEVER